MSGCLIFIFWKNPTREDVFKRMLTHCITGFLMNHSGINSSTFDKYFKISETWGMLRC